MGGGIIIQTEKKTETLAGKLSACICLIMDVQLNVQNGAFNSAMYYKNATHAATPYGIVHCFDWGWKDTPGLRLT